jgi:hypothetical protein
MAQQDQFTRTSPDIDVRATGEGRKRLTWRQYKWPVLIVAVITILEVLAYYVPSFVASPRFLPTLLIMSAVKFAIVVSIAAFTLVYLIKRRVKG